MSKFSRILLVLGLLCGVAAIFSAIGPARARQAVGATERNAADDPPFDPKELDAIRPVSHPIPDDPPPHEGALVEYPDIVGVTDVLTVSVLQPLSGRPLEGERLVSSDGTIDLGYYGRVRVNGLTLEQAKKKIVTHLRQYLSLRQLGLIKFDDQAMPALDRFGKLVLIPAEKTTQVAVSFSARASQVYYVVGAVEKPGRYPFTGNDTVLDAISFAGNLTAQARTADMALVRPARDGRPAKILRIDYNAVLNGEVDTDYQLFPGDRLIVSGETQH